MKKTKKLPRALLNRYKLLRRTKSEKAVFIVAFVLFVLYSLLILTPIIYLFIIGGFASPNAYSTYQIFRTTNSGYTIFNIELGQHLDNFGYLKFYDIESLDILVAMIFVSRSSIFRRPSTATTLSCITSRKDS